MSISSSTVSNRADLRLYPSLAAGLIAATPWIALLLATLTMALQGPTLIALLAPLALTGGVLQFIRNGMLRGPATVVGLSIHGNELWAQLGDGRQLPVSASRDSRLGGRMAFLRLSSPASRFWSRPLVLIHFGPQFSNVESEPFRHLRVWLRLRSS